jgi:hypothetical protein
MMYVGTVIGVVVIALLVGVGLYNVTMWLIKRNFK